MQYLFFVNNFGDSLQEKVPSNISRINQARLGDFSADRVDDLSLFFGGEHRANFAVNDEFREINKEIVVDELVIFEYEKRLFALKMGKKKENTV